MDKIIDWLNHDMLTIKVSKPNYMIMTTQGKRIDDQQCTITENDSIVKRVSQRIFLGIVVDDQLTWKSHIKIGIPYNAKQVLSIKSFLSLHDSLIKPYFSYMQPYGKLLSKTHTSKLELLHKKVVRIISFSDYRAHTGVLFRKLKIMTLAEISPLLYYYTYK